jgi:hypothetical protein
MKKIFCNVNMFDLEQLVYIIDDETDSKDIVTMSTIEELPATISALSSEMGIANVVLSGNIVTYNTLLSDNIIQYSKLNYNQNEIKVEVVK